MPDRVIMADGRRPVTVDADEFELIKTMVAEKGGNLNAALEVSRELQKQGYEESRARELAVLAKNHQ